MNPLRRATNCYESLTLRFRVVLFAATLPSVNASRLAADGVLIVHAFFIAFVVLGLVAILLGIALKWGWVRNFWFRVLHLAAIAFVVAQTFMGMACPLTTWENALRVSGGQEAYSERGFIEHWLHRVIFFDAEPWVFTLCYSLFALAVAGTMWLAPPRRSPRPSRQGTERALPTSSSNANAI